MSTRSISGGGRYAGVKTLPPSCTVCPEICEPLPPGALWACSRPVQGLLYLLLSNE